MQLIPRHLPAAAARLTPISRLSAATRLNLVIGLPLRHPAALSNLLAQIYDPASPDYHHYVTAEEFANRFGPTEADYQAVIAFAKANGLTVTGTHPNRTLVDVNGSVADIEKALHLTMNVYQHPTEPRTFFAPDTDSSLVLAVPVLSISGLDNFSRPHPRLKALPLAQLQNPSPNAGSGPSGTYLGNDFRAAYVPGTSLNGSGQTVGLLQFDGYTAGDIAYYENKAGLPSVPLQNILLDGFSGNPTGNGGEVEVSLDIEMAISMATNLSQVIVYEAGPSGSWHDILNRMATDNLARQLSCSWYIPNGGSDPVADQIWQQMAAQGQSFFNASGDDDAYSGLIPFPGDSPYITQVGGTTLTTSGPGGAWVSEKVWNWGDGIGGGGGISTQYPIPNWQTNISMTANQGSTTKRNSPDVSLTADQVYVRADGADQLVGGTSCAAPLWAGFAALVNQQAVAAGRPAIGFINPAIDTIGKSATYTSAFHDITTGNNESSGSPTKFSAVTGYDLCTGWGTPAGQGLINALANPEPLLITPATGFAASGGVGGPFTVTSQSLTLTNSGTNTLTWSLVNTSLWLNAAPGGGTLTPGGPAATVTASLNAAASNLVVGAYSATIWFTNLNDNFAQGRSFSLSVLAPPTIILQPTNQAVLDGTTVAFTVAATGGLPLAYQWQYNSNNLTDGGAISGSTTTNLVISNASTNTTGTYSVVVTNLAGVKASSNALLTLISSGPVITAQPSNQTAVVGTTAQFAVAALGSKPFFYQWAFNTTNLLGATNAMLTLTNVQFAQAGSYSVMISNSIGSTLSSNASLTVTTCDPAPAGMVAWWPAEGNPVDQIGGNNGTTTAITYTNGEVGQAFVFNGSSSSIMVPASTSLNVGLSNGFTIELWIKPVDIYVPSRQVQDLLEWNNGSGSIGTHLALSTDNPGDLYANIVDASGTSHEIDSAAGLMTSNVLQHVALTYDKTAGIAVLYRNGIAVTNQALGSFTPQTSYNFYFGERPSGPFTPSHYNGSEDEVSLYNRALSSNEIAAIYNAGSAGKCFTPVPPVITSQPTNLAVFVGQTAGFSVSANGTLPLSYQWSFNTTNIPGATNSTLTLPNTQLTNAGNYAVLVTNIAGTALSSNAVLTVNDKLDHFGWGQIPSPRFINVSFPVVIQALGTTNALFTNFTGTVILNSTNGITISPPLSAAFVQGLWTGSITVSQPATNLVLRADDGTGQTGLANAINVASLPSLGFTRSDNFLLIYWPVASSNFALETSTSLLPPQWVPASPPLQIGDQYLESIQMNTSNQFFRLRLTSP